MGPEREKFLARIKNSLRHSLLPASSPEHPGSFQGYTFQADAPVEKMVEDFARELRALSGHVHILEDAESVVAVILEILQKHQAEQIMAWDAAGLGLVWLPEALTAAGIMVVDNHLAVDSEGRK